MKKAMLWLLLLLYIVMIQSNNVCVRNLGQWSRPEEQPRIVQSYTIGFGRCPGHPPLSFTPEGWNGMLPHPCQYPQVFDKIAKETCLARRPTNPAACQYVGHVFRKGMCSEAPDDGGSPPITLDCGDPLFWGWERITTVPQLKPGWKGTCILHYTPVEFGLTGRESRKGRIRQRRDAGGRRSLGEGPCTQCLIADGRVISRVGKPRSCTQFDLTPCVHGKRQISVYNRCNGTEGVLCYKEQTTPLAPPRNPRESGTVVETEAEASKGPDACTPCVTNAPGGRRTADTLIYHAQAPKGCKPQNTTCIRNKTMYSLCTHKNQSICYNPNPPVRLNVTLYAGLAKYGTRNDPEGEGRLYFLNYTLQLQQGEEPLKLRFDACAALSKGGGSPCGQQAWISAYKTNHKYLCPTNLNWAYGNPNQWLPCAGNAQCSGWQCVCDHSGGGYQGCPHINSFRRGSANEVEIEVDRKHPPVVSYGFGIDGPRSDPTTYLTIKVEKVFEGEVKSLG